MDKLIDYGSYFIFLKYILKSRKLEKFGYVNNAGRPVSLSMMFLMCRETALVDGEPNRY